MLISSKSSEELRNRISRENEIFCSSLFLSARWFVVNQVCQKGLQFIVLPNQEAAEYAAADLYNLTEADNVFFLPHSGRNIERSNYKSSLNVQRTAAIAKIIENKGELMYIVSYPEALDELIPSKKQIKGYSLKIRKGEDIDRDNLTETLFSHGFERVDFVSAPGQFAVRGSVMDIFSYSFNEPYRISFFANEVEDIHIFNANTQISSEELPEIEIVADISSEENTESIVNILPKNTLVWLDSSDVYKDKEIFNGLQQYKRVFLDVPLGREVDAIRFSISPQPVFNKNFELLSADISNKIENNYKVYIYGERESQLERVKSILTSNSARLPEFVKSKNIHSGFIDNEDKICCYTDHEIFDRFHRVRIRRSVEKTEQLTLNELNSFNVGDYIVHIDHGVGIFGGLVRMLDDKGRLKEVVKLIYKDGDVVFVNVHALHKISRFRSAEGEVPRINKLGGKTWTTFKSNAKKKVKDIARDLINLYAKRMATKGHAFPADTYLQEELESSFMYEDTPDQEAATKAVKKDMEESYPMDRLVCGDVGFGKTEIAIRAAFKAVSDSCQVAVLVPTTILALQHYNTFISRLKDFPCNIEYVSRLRTAKQLSEIKRKLAAGQIDILIGTHKILGSGFEFKNLGLLIIDEEQKFGVSAKEKLRQLKANVDTLTLTATPIPRTLQFSLLGARDLSIISTPPPNRIPIQTEIILFDEKEIRSIINYEINRGGQVFFLHNKVDELPSIYDILHRLLPDIRICVAHGKMKAEELEDRILEFMRGDYDLLLCTTIIENGLDIPNANTIIINQAQNIGLSDLHQLRGRVGRSNKKAFCYLIVPPLISITEDARRRLKAIEEFSDLGSGFNIAMQDLDIRGAGNLLGSEQSGFISEMGYETYQKILAEAMEELGVESGIEHKSIKGRYVEDCTIETDQMALIPDEYIDVTAEKIRIYKHLDSLTSDKEIDRYAAVLADRFGTLPPEVENLFYVVKIRNLGVSLGFEKIIIKNGMLIDFFVFNPMSAYYKSELFESILAKVAENPAIFTMKQKDGKLRLVSRGVDSLAKSFALLNKLK